MTAGVLSFVSGVRGLVGDKGVDVVVNSLCRGGRCRASVRLVGRGGRFVEVGKADIHGGSKLSLEVFAAGVTYASVMLDKMVMSGEEDGAVGEYLQSGLEARMREGAVGHPVNVFDVRDAGLAVGSMARGEHIGKNVLAMRGQVDVTVDAGSWRKGEGEGEGEGEGWWLVVGGTSGFGAAIVEWLAVERGVRAVVVMSRSGLTGKTAGGDCSPGPGS